MKNLKVVFIILLSVVLVLVCSNFVLAADDEDINSLFGETSGSSENSENSNSEEDEDEEGESFDIITKSNNTNNNSNNTSNNTSNTNSAATLNTANNTNTNANTNRSVSNTNELAKTGIENNGGVITVFVLVCGISAVYSYKKFNEYKNL